MGKMPGRGRAGRERAHRARQDGERQGRTVKGPRQDGERQDGTVKGPGQNEERPPNPKRRKNPGMALFLEIGDYFHHAAEDVDLGVAGAGGVGDDQVEGVGGELGAADLKAGAAAADG